MPVRRLKSGDKIHAEDWNELALLHEANYEERAYLDEATPQNKTSNLYGVCGETVPVFSLLEITSTSTGITSEEVPVVTVQKPATAKPKLLFTNGEVSGTKVPLIPLYVGQPFKLDVVTTDTFTVGGQCGPKGTTFQGSASGCGLICLTAPVTYQSTRKFIWAVVATGPKGGKLFLTTTTITAKTGTSSPWTAGTGTGTMCEIYNDSGTKKLRTLTGFSETLLHFGDDAIASGRLVQCKVVDGEWVVDVDYC